MSSPGNAVLELTHSPSQEMTEIFRNSESGLLNTAII